MDKFLALSTELSNLFTNRSRPDKRGSNLIQTHWVFGSVCSRKDSVRAFGNLKDVRPARALFNPQQNKRPRVSTGNFLHVGSNARLNLLHDLLEPNDLSCNIQCS